MFTARDTVSITSLVLACVATILLAVACQPSEADRPIAESGTEPTVVDTTEHATQESAGGPVQTTAVPQPTTAPAAASAEESDIAPSQATIGTRITAREGAPIELIVRATPGTIITEVDRPAGVSVDGVPIASAFSVSHPDPERGDVIEVEIGLYDPASTAYAEGYGPELDRSDLSFLVLTNDGWAAVEPASSTQNASIALSSGDVVLPVTRCFECAGQLLFRYAYQNVRSPGTAPDCSSEQPTWIGITSVGAGDPAVHYCVEGSSDSGGVTIRALSNRGYPLVLRSSAAIEDVSVDGDRGANEWARVLARDELVGDSAGFAYLAPRTELTFTVRRDADQWIGLAARFQSLTYFATLVEQGLDLADEPPTLLDPTLAVAMSCFGERDTSGETREYGEVGRRINALALCTQQHLEADAGRSVIAALTSDTLPRPLNDREAGAVITILRSISLASAAGVQGAIWIDLSQSGSGELSMQVSPAGGAQRTVDQQTVGRTRYCARFTDAAAGVAMHSGPSETSSVISRIPALSCGLRSRPGDEGPADWTPVTFETNRQTTDGWVQNDTIVGAADAGHPNADAALALDVAIDGERPTHVEVATEAAEALKALAGSPVIAVVDGDRPEPESQGGAFADGCHLIGDVTVVCYFLLFGPDTTETIAVYSQPDSELYGTSRGIISIGS